MKCLLTSLFLLSLPLVGFAGNGIDYSNAENWATLEQEKNKSVDVFYIAPTVGPPENKVNMALDDIEKRTRFLGTINMVRGVYEDTCRIYAPYYRQAGLGAYYMKHDESKPLFDKAYKDVRKAFKYYMKHYNNGRPIIVGGFSQGAQHSIRLLKEYTSKRKFRNQFVAGYAIGWRLTDDDLKHHKCLKPAQGETDTGVVLVFNSESPTVKGTFIVPTDCKSYCINPLNWKTNSTQASKELNLGACFTDFDANILKEIPEFTGATIDEKRGVLKLEDLDPQKYPGGYFEDGIYHRYEYNLYYRNLEQNVAKRVKAFLAKQK